MLHRFASLFVFLVSFGVFSRTAVGDALCIKTSSGAITTRKVCLSGEQKATIRVLATQAARSQLTKRSLFTGVIGFDQEAVDAGGDYHAFVSLPFAVSPPLVDNHVLVVNNSLVDSGCSAGSCVFSGELSENSPAHCGGTYVSPLVESGYICIYPIAAQNCEGISGTPFAAPGSPNDSLAIANTHGFRVRCNAVAAGDIYFNGIWFYRAPN